MELARNVMRNNSISCRPNDEQSPIGVKTKSDVLEGTTITERANILIIDDEEMVRGTIKEILEEDGHKVIGAESGEKGIEIFRRQRFDLVLTDLGMPRMSGWEVVYFLKRINAEVPIILLTGWADQTDIELAIRASESGIDAVLKKPVMIQELLSVVSQTIRNRVIGYS